MQGGVDCKAPGLKFLKHKAMKKLRIWPLHEFLHMKRDWNRSADRLAGEDLHKEKGMVIDLDKD